MWSARVPDSPVGALRLWATEAGLRRLDFRGGSVHAGPGEILSETAAPTHLKQAVEAVREYFQGTRRDFDLAVDLSGVTPFQHRVYERLRRIPWGHVATYGEVARDIGEELSASRAVGQAVGSNPVAIVIPCHRVVASDGRLVGFGGGIGRKVALLRLEGIDVDGTRPSSRVHPEILRLPL